jgi:hypothetical protein
VDCWPRILINHVNLLLNLWWVFSLLDIL